MQLKLFYRTQRDIAIALNQFIDAYWDEKIQEAELIEGAKSLYEHNKEKLVKNKEFTKVVQQQCGKRRLTVIEKILNM